MFSLVFVTTERTHVSSEGAWNGEKLRASDAPNLSAFHKSLACGIIPTWPSKQSFRSVRSRQFSPFRWRVSCQEARSSSSTGKKHRKDGSFWEGSCIETEEKRSVRFEKLYKLTAVSTKVVPQKRKSVRDNADWYYG